MGKKKKDDDFVSCVQPEGWELNSIEQKLKERDDEIMRLKAEIYDLERERD